MHHIQPFLSHLGVSHSLFLVIIIRQVWKILSRDPCLSREWHGHSWCLQIGGLWMPRVPFIYPEPAWHLCSLLYLHCLECMTSFYKYQTCLNKSCLGLVATTNFPDVQGWQTHPGCEVRSALSQREETGRCGGKARSCHHLLFLPTNVWGPGWGLGGIQRWIKLSPSSQGADSVVQ